MKYYIIVGEASGDLHASRLMLSLKKSDKAAEFRFFGGDKMIQSGGTCVRHYRDLAYMGFVPVLLHLPVIMRNMAFCKRDITEWQPHVVILVDYPGFNLDIARYVHAETHIPVYYYISPKIWAWKEYRIRNIRRDVDEMFSILPFEISFYQDKHNYPIHYVGNPTAEEVRSFRQSYGETFDEFRTCHSLQSDKPIIALLAGSRRQEIKDNLPAMLRAADAFTDRYQLVISGAPAIERGYYDDVLKKHHLVGEAFDTKNCSIVYDTYGLLSHAAAALVTSGTATLETALFGVPQVVCYKTPLPRLIRFAFNHIIKVRFISLVNLIADSEIVPELLADRFTVAEIRSSLGAILPGGSRREVMLQGYKTVEERLGDDIAPDNAAAIICRLLSNAAGV